MKAFIITIKGMDASERLAERAFTSAQTYGYDPYYFPAYTKDDSITFLEANNVRAVWNKDTPYFDLYNRWTSVGGTRGCFASHYSLWLKAIELDEPIIILEHDAIITSAWNNPEWKDILHLDWEGSIRRREMRNGFDRYSPVKEHSVFRMGFFPGEASGICSMNCAYAYAITPDAALVLISDAKNNGWFACDRFIREPLVDIYTINPKIAEEQPEAIEMFTTSF
jgi:GR25 family glycosyltransferase involved in LPS biosynthesis